MPLVFWVKDLLFKRSNFNNRQIINAVDTNDATALTTAIIDCESMGIFSDFLANENVINLINVLFENNAVVSLMKPNDWERLCRNRAALHIILAHSTHINYSALSSNAGAIKYLEENPDRIDYNELSRNHAAMHLILAKPLLINWYAFSENPSALPFLIKDYNKYVLGHLMANPAAMDIITKDMSSINYEYLSKNINAIHLLEDKFINVKNLIANSSIFINEC
jgi:hypothetical protein